MKFNTWQQPANVPAFGMSAYASVSTIARPRVCAHRAFDLAPMTAAIATVKPAATDVVRLKGAFPGSASWSPPL